MYILLLMPLPPVDEPDHTSAPDLCLVLRSWPDYLGKMKRRQHRDVLAGVQCAAVGGKKNKIVDKQ
jgi:hypothetical protein